MSESNTPAKAPSKSSVLSLYTYNEKRASQEGAPITFPPNEDESIPTFYVCRSHQSNTAWAAAREREVAKYKGRMRAGKMTADDWANITKELFVTLLLKGWKNFLDDEGHEIEYTEANVRKYMASHPELFDYLMDQTTIDENFRQSAADEDQGNLSAG